MNVNCPHCNQKLDAGDDLIGVEVQCPTCSKSFTVPNANAVQTSSAVPAPPLPATVPQNTKPCPYCGETILAVAKKCKHCGEWLDGSRPPTSPSQQWPIKTVPGWNIPFFLLFTLDIYHVFWLYRVFKELHARKATDLTPGKAVGYMFIPFFNFGWVFVAWKKLGDAIATAYSQAGLAQPATGIVWLPPISLFIAIGLNLAAPGAGSVTAIALLSVALCIIQGQMNRLAEHEGTSTRR